MNKQKFIEDRYTKRNQGERKTDSLLEGLACEVCDRVHGTTLAGGGKVILSVVCNKILCFADGLKEYGRTGRKHSGRKPKDVLSAFGITQEVLL